MTNGQLGSRLQPTRTRPVSDFRIRGSKCASIAQACRASLNALRVGNSWRRWRGGIVRDFEELGEELVRGGG